MSDEPEEDIEKDLAEILDTMVKLGFVSTLLGDDGELRYSITDIGTFELAFLKDD